MQREAVRGLFVKAFSEVMPPTESDFGDEMTLAYLGMSSMDVMEVEMVMGELSELQFPEDAMAGVVTVGDVLDVVESLGAGE